MARTRCVLAGDGPVCGDGVTESGEACDDGNGNPTDGCTNTCQVALCGDGVARQGVEQCDANGESATCDANCTTAFCGDGTTNSTAESLRHERCVGNLRQRLLAGVCGDGNVNQAANEQCDSGVSLPSATPTAAPPLRRRDHERDRGEQCDDGNTANGDGCSARASTSLR